MSRREICLSPRLSSYYLSEMMLELSAVVSELVKAGDLQIARHLLPVVNNYKQAFGVFGTFICPDGFERMGIEQILKKNKAKSLLGMVAALHPKWDLLLGISNRPQIEMFPEEKLRALLLSKEQWTIERKESVGKGKRKRWQIESKTESRNHPLAELVEMVFAMHENESKRINLFVAYLQQGWLWSLAGKKGETGRMFLKCPWLGRAEQATLKEIKAHLRKVTAGDYRRLSVFRTFLVVRQAVYAKGGPLVTDRPEYIWNHIETRIGKAWPVMDRKPKKKKAG